MPPFHVPRSLPCPSIERDLQTYILITLLPADLSLIDLQMVQQQRLRGLTGLTFWPAERSQCGLLNQVSSTRLNACP